MGRARPGSLLAAWLVVLPGLAFADDEALIFTPAGFDRVGRPKMASGDRNGRIEITVRDAKTNLPTPCRVNVVGPDGNYYQPAVNHLSPFSLTGEWPKTGKGNRIGKAPIRYLGRFFYCNGKAIIAVPAGEVRVEVWKGFEYEPHVVNSDVGVGAVRQIDVVLERPVDMAALGYVSGDSHLHFPRRTDEDERIIFDLLQAEDIHYGCLLAYNEPAGPYIGFMDKLDSPQLHGLGNASVRGREGYQIISGQEYRSAKFGHLNLFLRRNLARTGESGNADDGPPYGLVGRDTHRQGGYAFYAHGGYAQSIYADFIQHDVDGVELLQFGVYRGIGLEDWYRILNIGYRFPCIGASDYPACRKLGDCVTYVYQDPSTPRDITGWLKACAEGRSFVTSGPLLLLDVDGERPGSVISRAGAGVHRVEARIRVKSLVAPIETIQLLVNGRTLEEWTVPQGWGKGRWIELRWPIALERSSWIAARAFSKARTGAPDGEAHTNPVYVDVNEKAPYDRSSLDHLVGRLDEQMEIHRKRSFRAKAQVLDYFQASRDLLLKIRAAGGLPGGGLPPKWLDEKAPHRIDPAARSHTDQELAEFLKPVPARTPAEALKTFEVADGFRMELVAAEPLVASPVAAAFDEEGNLYVAEMRDYPFHPKPGRRPLGTVRLLRDTDGDGRFDDAHNFAEGLLWAAGVAPWKGGVYVAAPPDIWYLKDTDGDHRADVRRKVFTGFGDENEQGILNNLTWGLDHLIYGSTSTNGGLVRPLDNPRAAPVDVRRKDFRFDPVSGKLEAITGTVQFGNTFDDWGNRFLCSESRPLLHAVLPLRYLARNPNLPVPAAIEDVAGHPVPIHRISPLERWRQIRSSRRIAHGERSADSAGASHHVIDAAAGVTVYRGGAYPAQYLGNVFVCDAQNNLIHRMILTPSGPTFKASSGDAGTEFVRSYDNWFRPVNLVNAPDGTLYVLDMSREIIEAVHIPLDVMKHLDLRHGRDQGRIYRFVPPGFQRAPAPKLAHASASELVEALESPHGWIRDTAHRLIYERQDRAALNPLRRLLAESTRPSARVHALWSLNGLHSLEERDLLTALSDASPRVREHGVRLAESRLDASQVLLDHVVRLSSDSDPRVRFQVALSLGETRDPRAVDGLARVARADAGNRWTTTAVLSSSTNVSDRLLADFVSDATFVSSAPGSALLEQLVLMIGARHRPAEVARALESLSGGRSCKRTPTSCGAGCSAWAAGSSARVDISRFLGSVPRALHRPSRV